MFFFFFFNDTATTEIYTLSLHDALPISEDGLGGWLVKGRKSASRIGGLELRNGITAAGGLAEVEAAKLVVQDAFVMDMDIGGARRGDFLLGGGGGGAFFFWGGGGGGGVVLWGGGGL